MRLSPKEQALLNLMLSHSEGADVSIDDMYLALTMLGPAKYSTQSSKFSTQQQYVGAFVSRINHKQDVYEIVPGELKRTYRVKLKEKNSNA